VASRLQLPSNLSGLLTTAPARPAPRDAGAPAPPRRPLDRSSETERTFLALCIALPAEGREALEGLDLDAHLTSPAVRRAAAHLREHLAAPTEGVPDGDDELESLLAELTLRASREPADRTTLEVQTLHLDLARLDRAIAAARREEPATVDALAREKSQRKTQLDAAVDRAMAGSSSAE